ncbi:hypothetical protein GCM10023307_29180 [Lysobacter hankyongensis]|uniref:Uncharacterized protein n=1 Tax=Lysobacter hankyongensis TaxID=1176535 RepID=A0ABP9BUZ5_9GAMM
MAGRIWRRVRKDIGRLRRMADRIVTDPARRMRCRKSSAPMPAPTTRAERVGIFRHADAANAG